MDTIIYEEELKRLDNFLNTEELERCPEKQYFLETIKNMAQATQVAIEDEQKSHNETKRNYTEKLKAKDCLIVSLQEGIATGEAKVLAAEQLANDYKQRFTEEQKAHQEMRRSYSETVNSLIENNDCLKVSLQELSESNQTSDLSPKQVGEIFQRGLEKAKSSELEPKDLIISNLQSQNKALCVQIQHSTSDIRKGLDETRKGVKRDLQELNTFCLGLEEHFQIGFASYKQQVEFLEQELEKERASHADTRESKQNIINTLQAEKNEMERQNLKQKDVLYQSLDDEYRAELSDVKQLMKNLNQELEEEIQLRKEREDIIFTIQAEKEDLCSQMQKQTSHLNKLYDETKRNFTRELEEKDVLYQSLEQKYKTQLSDSHQLIESLKQELDRERQDHLDALQEKENIILTIQAAKKACLQTIKDADEKELQFAVEKRQFEENLEQKDVLYRSLEDKYKSDLFKSKQQIENVQQELDKERQDHIKAIQERLNIILTFQEDSEALYLQATKDADEKERQFAEEKRQFEENLEQKDVLYQSLEDKYKSDLFKSKQQIENVQQELDKERQDHIKAIQERLNIILTFQEDSEALYLQATKDADEKERHFAEEKRQFEKNLAQKDVLYQSLDDKYRVELSESRQQVENLHRKLEEERKLCKAKKEMIRIVQGEKVELYNQMEDKARAMERQFEIEKKNFMRDLEEREVSFQDLEKKYETEVFNSKRQIESLQQQMEKEREEAEQTILTIQSKKEALSVQMVQTIAAVEKQFDVEKSKFQKELNKCQSSYRDLRKKYIELFLVEANSC